MSIAGISNNATAAWQSASRQKASAPQPQPTTTDSSTAATGGYDPFRNLSPTDSVTVNLPGGLSIGYMHFGSPLDADGEAQMADSAAQLAAKFANSAGLTSVSGDVTDVANMDAGSPQSDGASDLLHVGLPDGISFDIRHWSQGSETDAEQSAIADQLTKTASELADALKAYMGASPAGAAGASGSAGNAASSAARDVSV